MNILIIEDDELKHTHLENFVRTLLPKANFIWKKSYQSGLQEIMLNHYDLVLLDMSMNIYEKTAQETGGSFEPYAGRLILSEIDINDIITKVIVITGYDIYNDGKTLDTLKAELREEFGEFYLDTIYFIGLENKWKIELSQIVHQYFSEQFKTQQINIYLSILVVEDSEHKIEKIRKYLEEFSPNLRVIFAKDQIQAQKYLKSEKFDLMLLDMQLPIRFGESEPDKKGGENILTELYMYDSFIQPTKVIALTEFEDLHISIRDNFSELGAIKFDISSDNWKLSLNRAIQSIAKSKKQNKKIIYCEEQNDELYNLIGFTSVEFRGLKGGSRKVYEAAKFEKDKFAVRDRDYLTRNEIKWLTQTHFDNYFILDYYCFENYLYHPDNLEECCLNHDIEFDKVSYLNEILSQKKSKFLKIVQDYQISRNSYFDFNDNNKKFMDKNPENEIVKCLQSDNFNTFYYFFDMKGTHKDKGFDKSYLDKLNLNQKQLSQTKWLKEKMSEIFSEIIVDEV